MSIKTSSKSNNLRRIVNKFCRRGTHFTIVNEYRRQKICKEDEQKVDFEEVFKPWYNNELINFLQEFLKPEFLVFEYGAGHSTLYYSAKVAKVFAIETKQEWLDFVLANQVLPTNIEIKLCLNLLKFATEIENFSEKFFDVIVVDSRDRAKCLLKATGYLRKGGILILDNSERPNLLAAKQHLLELSFVEKLFSGRRDDGSISFSSVFFKP